MKLQWVENWKVYILFCNYEEKDIPKSKHFRWQPKIKKWYTKDFRIAKNLIQYADEPTKKMIEHLELFEHNLPKSVKEPRKKSVKKPKYEWTVKELMDPEYGRDRELRY